MQILRFFFFGGGGYLHQIKPSGVAILENASKGVFIRPLNMDGVQIKSGMAQ